MNTPPGHAVAISTASAFHPGRSIEIYKDDKRIGTMGEIHPNILQQFDIKQPVIACEMDLEAIQATPLPHFKPFSRFPSIRRDLAIVVDAATPAAKIRETITQKAGEYLSDLHIFDVYQGKGIDPTKKSIALGLTFQHSERTLRDEEINEVIHHVIAGLERELAATLRI